jgi:phosphate-selective porin
MSAFRPYCSLAAAGVVLLIVSAVRVDAQNAQKPGAETAPDTDYAEPKPVTPARIPATGFVMPDVPDGWNRYTSFDGHLFSTTFSFVTIVDYNAFVQNDKSKAQVGEQDSQWDLRTMRLMTHGRLKFAHPVDYFVSLEVKGQDHVQTGASSLGFTDVELTTSLGKLGRLNVGKIKEPFVYEMVGDAANLQQQERALTPFFASRGIGLRLGRPFAKDAMTWSVGWYNDWWDAHQSFKESGNDFAGRLTAVPYFAADGANYVHVGIDARYTGADEGKLQFRGRPESNVTDYYVDSGKIAATHASQLALESLVGRGPLLVSAEYASSWVNAAASGDPFFWGGSIVVSYALTGEHRPYDKQVAYSRRILPQRRIGAFELVARYSHVDVDDALVQGGIFDRGTIGLNWWATRRWKAGFDYGLIDLNRDHIHGTTHAFHMRLQWAY